MKACVCIPFYRYTHGTRLKVAKLDLTASKGKRLGKGLERVIKQTKNNRGLHSIRHPSQNRS